MNILHRIKKRFFYNPVKELLTNAEFRRLENSERCTIGKIHLFGHEVVYPDGYGFLHSLREIFIEEVYKFNCSTEKPYIIDAGANMGLSVLYFKQLFPASKVLAFEPDVQIFNLLQKNIAASGGADVELRNAAVWVDNSELEFFSEGSLAGSTELDSEQKNNKYLVRAERLKEILNNAKVDFLKIDIEGAENTLIFDIEEELTNVRNLFLEYHSIAGKPQQLGAILQLLSSAGFRYIVKEANSMVTYPFLQRISTGFDLQLNIFCFRA